MTEKYDVIIVGGGPMGLAAAYECVKKEGKKVLLLERFNKFANPHGSSVGYSRQFRVSYSEKNLSDLALRTYDMWVKLMNDMNDQSLLQITGCLWFGDRSVESGEGNIDKAIENLKDLGQTEPKDYRVLDGKEAIMNDPQFAFVSQAVADIDNAKALYTEKGGTVNVPGLVKRYADYLTATPNATLIKCALVTKIDHSSEEYVEVKAQVAGAEATYRGDKIILTPGAYVNDVLLALNPPFKHHINLIIYLWSSTYFGKKCENVSGTNPATWPIWYFFGPKPGDDDSDDSDDPKDYNDYYGFPSEPGRPDLLRVAPAFTSQEIFDFMLFPPEVNERFLDEDALKFTSRFVEKSMPDLKPSRCTEHEVTCVAGFAQKVDESADEGAGFVIDFLQSDVKRIVLFTGGWAMKFVPMLGKILSDLAIHGKTEYQDLIQPMNINRGILLSAKDSPGQKKLKPSKCSVAEKQKAFRKIWC